MTDLIATPPSRSARETTGESQHDIALHAHELLFSRRMSPELCIVDRPRRVKRAQGRPGGRCTRGSRATQLRKERENHRYRR